MVHLNMTHRSFEFGTLRCRRCRDHYLCFPVSEPAKQRSCDDNYLLISYNDKIRACLSDPITLLRTDASVLNASVAALLSCRPNLRFCIKSLKRANIRAGKPVPSFAVELATLCAYSEVMLHQRDGQRATDNVIAATALQVLHEAGAERAGHQIGSNLRPCETAEHRLSEPCARARIWTDAVLWELHSLTDGRFALSGSVARGTATAASDTDLLLLVPHRQRYLQLTAVQQARALLHEALCLVYRYRERHCEVHIRLQRHSIGLLCPGGVKIDIIPAFASPYQQYIPELAPSISQTAALVQRLIARLSTLTPPCSTQSFD